MLKRIAPVLATATGKRKIFFWLGLSALTASVLLTACVGPLAKVVSDSTDTAPSAAAATVDQAPAAPEETVIVQPESETASNLVLTLATAELEISNLKINPAEVSAGKEFLITATLANPGDSEATQTLELMVNSVPKLVTDVTLPAGETGELRVVGREETPGTYTVNLNGLNEQFVVTESAPTMILSSPDPSETTPAPAQNSGGCSGCGSGSSGCGCSGGGTTPTARSSGGCGGCGG